MLFSYFHRLKISIQECDIENKYIMFKTFAFKGQKPDNIILKQAHFYDYILIKNIEFVF